MDTASTKELEFMEKLRRMEITRGLGLAARDRTRAVRRERMRWAVSSWELLFFGESPARIERGAEGGGHSHLAYPISLKVGHRTA